MKIRFVFILAILLFSTTHHVKAQATGVSEPPFMARSGHFMMILFNLKPDEVQPLLPPGVMAKINDSGMVTGGLELYEADRTYGISQYSMAFVFVEVANLESNNGTPGHWAVWGRVNDDQALKSMVDNFNFPYQFSNIKLIRHEWLHEGIIDGGTIRLKIKYNEDAPFNAEGIVNMCSLSKAGNVLTTEVPWFSTGSVGDLVALDITSSGDIILDMVQATKPYFSLISTDQTFSYSRVVNR